MVQEPIRGHCPINSRFLSAWAYGVHEKGMERHHCLYLTASTDQITMKQFSKLLGMTLSAAALESDWFLPAFASAECREMI